MTIEQMRDRLNDLMAAGVPGETPVWCKGLDEAPVQQIDILHVLRTPGGFDILREDMAAEYSEPGHVYEDVGRAVLLQGWD